MCCITQTRKATGTSLRYIERKVDSSLLAVVVVVAVSNLFVYPRYRSLMVSRCLARKYEPNFSYCLLAGTKSSNIASFTASPNWRKYEATAKITPNYSSQCRNIPRFVTFPRIVS